MGPTYLSDQPISVTTAWPPVLSSGMGCPPLQYLSHRSRRLAEFTSCCSWISQVWDDTKMVKIYSWLYCSPVWDLSIHSPPCPFPHLQGVAKTPCSDTACGGQRRSLHLHMACCVIFGKISAPAECWECYQLLGHSSHYSFLHCAVQIVTSSSPRTAKDVTSPLVRSVVRGSILHIHSRSSQQSNFSAHQSIYCNAYSNAAIQWLFRYSKSFRWGISIALW